MSLVSIVALATTLSCDDLLAHAPPSQPLDRSVLPIRQPAFRGTVKTLATQSTGSPIPSVVAPTGAPNVMIAIIDNVAYGVSGTVGGLIPTYAVDALAASPVGDYASPYGFTGRD
jgi:arylsulfatase